MADTGCSDRTDPRAGAAIREARVEDAPRILDVINTTNKAFYEEIVPPDRYREPFLALEDVQAESRRMTFYVSVQNGRIVGVVGLGTAGGVGIVGRLYVLPGSQRKGIGAALLAHAEDEARRRGLREIVVWTDPKATWAVSFYRRRGYREIEPGIAFGDPHIDARARQHPDTLVVLRKSLSPPSGAARLRFYSSSRNGG